MQKHTKTKSTMITIEEEKKKAEPQRKPSSKRGNDSIKKNAPVQTLKQTIMRKETYSILGKGCFGTPTHKLSNLNLTQRLKSSGNETQSLQTGYNYNNVSTDKRYYTKENPQKNFRRKNSPQFLPIDSEKVQNNFKYLELEQKLKRSENKVQEQEQVIKNLKENQKKFDEKLAKKEQECTSQKSKVTQLCIKNKNNQQTINTQKIQIDKLSSEYNLLMQKNAGLQKKIMPSDKIIEQDQRAMLKLLKKKCDTLEKVNEELSKKVKEIENKAIKEIFEKICRENE